MGALAYTAYQRYNNSQGATSSQPPSNSSTAQISPAPYGSAFLPEESNHAANEELGLTLIRAMIAAANADGVIDQAERKNILERLQTVDLSPEEHSFIVQELLSPAKLETIVGGVASPELARQIYTVSLMAIEVDAEQEHHYMRMLANRLGLDASTVEQIHRRLEIG